MQVGSRYEPLELLGQGGAARVYRARDTKLRREVALKLLERNREPTSDAAARFRREAEVLARLSHPNIVSIFDTIDEPPAIVMELVNGRPLGAILAEGRHDQRALLALLEKVARAVQYAHESGIVHRDLKPANILVTADLEPKVADFGIARLMDDDSHLTRTGTLLGTPSYMAPEQVMGDRTKIDARTDVYALGAILHEVLVGVPPFADGSIEDLLARKIHREVEVPQDSTAPREALAIALRALARDPTRRHRSAGELADDLARFLRGGSGSRTRRRAPVGLVLLGVPVAAGIAALAARPSSPPAPPPVAKSPPAPAVVSALPVVEKKIPTPTPHVPTPAEQQEAHECRTRALNDRRTDSPRAEASARRAIELDPFDAGSWNALACVLEIRLGVASAVEVLDAGIAFVEAHPRKAAPPEASVDEQIRDIQESMLRRASVADLYADRAHIRGDTDPDRKRADLEKALEIDPTSTGNHVAYAGFLLDHDHDPRKALDAIEHLDAFAQPPAWTGYFVRARAKLELHDPDGAREDATTALGRPDGEVPHNRSAVLSVRAQALLVKGDRAAALADLEEAARLDPTEDRRRALEEARR